MTLLRVCRCGKLIPATRRRCPNCERAESTRRRTKPSGQIYQANLWRGKNGTRQRVLKRDHHTCQVCGAPATHVDHIIPITACASQGIDPYDASNCRALCASCAGRADGHRATAPPGGGSRITTATQPAIPRQLAARKIPLAARVAEENARLAAHRDPGTEKRCAHCEQWLPIDQFRANPRLRDGLHSWCRECCAEANREWRARERMAKAEADDGPLVA